MNMIILYLKVDFIATKVNNIYNIFIDVLTMLDLFYDVYQ